MRPTSLWIASLACLLLLGPGIQSLQASEMKLEAILIWATNDETSPDPKHKKISSDLAAKINKGPYRWKNYFEVSRQKAHIKANRTSKIQMSKQCVLEVKNLADGRIEVKLYGDNKLVSRQVEPMPSGATLILGGEAENETAWLIILKKEGE